MCVACVWGRRCGWRAKGTVGGLFCTQRHANKLQRGRRTRRSLSMVGQRCMRPVFPDAVLTVRGCIAGIRPVGGGEEYAYIQVRPAWSRDPRGAQVLSPRPHASHPCTATSTLAAQTNLSGSLPSRSSLSWPPARARWVPADLADFTPRQQHQQPRQWLPSSPSPALRPPQRPHGRLSPPASRLHLLPPHSCPPPDRRPGRAARPELSSGEEVEEGVPLGVRAVQEGAPPLHPLSIHAHKGASRADCGVHAWDDRARRSAPGPPLTSFPLGRGRPACRAQDGRRLARGWCSPRRARGRKRVERVQGGRRPCMRWARSDPRARGGRQRKARLRARRRRLIYPAHRHRPRPTKPMHATRYSLPCY